MSHSLAHRRAASSNAVVSQPDLLMREDQQSADRLAQRQRSFLRAIFPNKEDKEVDGFHVKIIAQAAVARVENHRMFLEFQRQALKESLEQLLEQGKIETRRSRLQYYQTNLTELHRLINDMSKDYFREMSARLDELEHSPNRPAIRTREETMLNTRIDEFERAIGISMSRFADILEEGV